MGHDLSMEYGKHVGQYWTIRRPILLLSPTGWLHSCTPSLHNFDSIPFFAGQEQGTYRPIGMLRLGSKIPLCRIWNPSRSKLFTDTHWWVKAQYWWHIQQHFLLTRCRQVHFFMTPWNTSARASAQQKSTATNIDVVVISIYIWLVVSTPLKNMKVKWDYCSQYMESHKKCLKPPTRLIYIYIPSGYLT